MALGLAAYSVTTYTSSVAAAGTVVSPSFSPAAGDVIFCVGFVDSPVTGAITENAPTNSGTALTWNLVKRENTFNANNLGGSLFAYWAYNANAQASITVTVNSPNTTALLKGVAVIGFTGADPAQTGAVSVATVLNPSASTTPTSSNLTTSAAGSWIWMAGWNWTNFRSGIAPASGQSAQIAAMDASSNGDTEWLQKENPQPASNRAAGTVVTMSATGGTSGDYYHLVAWEVVPAAVAAPAAGPYPAAPGRTWLRRFRHPQIPQAPAPAAGAVNANAGLATGTGAAPGADTGGALTAITVNAGLATGTGAALSPSTSNNVSAQAGLATGTGAALSPAVAIVPDAGLATGTGAAQSPSTAITVNAGLATGTGAALQPSVATSVSNALPVTQAEFTAVPVPAQIRPQVITAPPPAAPGTANAGLATGTGAALGPQAAIVVSAGLATGTGAALGPQAAIVVSAGLATGTGAALGPTVAIVPDAGLATGTGAAQPAAPAAGADAGLATGTGTAQSPVPAVAVNAGLATGTGAALQPSVQTSGSTNANAGLATGTAAALSPSAAIAVNAGLATGTGTAQSPAPGAGANASLAAGTGTAQPPVPAVAVNAGLATGTGAALQPSVQTSGSQNANAGLATGTGAALSPVPAVTVTAGLATATGAAFAPGHGVGAGLATATGAALTATANVTAMAQLATALGAALSLPPLLQNATSSPTVTDPRDGTATVTGVAHGASVTAQATSAPSVSDG